MLRQISARDAPYIRSVAARQDEGQGIILGLVTLMSTASLAAVAIELSIAKDAGGAAEALRIGLAMATVALSWFSDAAHLRAALCPRVLRPRRRR